MSKPNESNVESLARWAGPIDARGYLWRNEQWLEFAVTNQWAWVDDEQGGVTREYFDATKLEFYFV